MWYLLRIFYRQHMTGTSKDGWDAGQPSKEYTPQGKRQPHQEKWNAWSPRWAGGRKAAKAETVQQPLSSKQAHLRAFQAAPVVLCSTDWLLYYTRGAYCCPLEPFIFPTITWDHFSLLKIMKSRPQREKALQMHNLLLRVCPLLLLPWKGFKRYLLNNKKGVFQFDLHYTLVSEIRDVY